MTGSESSPPNLYDLIWGVRRDTPDWSIGRFRKLYDLIGTLDVRDKRVLDVCCGMGSKAYAALELGAYVWAYDGSAEGPNLLKKNVENQTAIPEKISGWKRYKIDKPDAKKLTIIPGMDISGITRHFGDEKFDIVYMGWALMHVADSKRAAEDIQQLTVPGGLVAASYYNQNYTSQLTFDIREYTFGLPIEEVADVTAKLGRRWGFEKMASLRELLENSDGNQTLSALKKMIDEKGYSPEVVESTILIEDMLTPYLYNLPDEQVVKYFEKYSKVIYRRPGLIRARKL